MNEELNEKIKDYVFQILATCGDLEKDDSVVNDLMSPNGFDYSYISNKKEDIPYLERAITFILNIPHKDRCDFQKDARTYMEERLEKTGDFIRLIIEDYTPMDIADLENRMDLCRVAMFRNTELDRIILEEVREAILTAYKNGEWSYLVSSYINPTPVYNCDVARETIGKELVPLKDAQKNTEIGKYTLSPSPYNDEELRLYRIGKSRIDEDFNLYTALKLVDGTYLIESERYYLGKILKGDDGVYRINLLNNAEEINRVYNEFKSHNTIFKTSNPSHVEKRCHVFDEFEEYEDHVEHGHEVIDRFFYLNNDNDSLYLVLNTITFMYMNSDYNLKRYYSYVHDTMKVDFSLYDFSHYVYTHNDKGLITVEIKKLNNLDPTSSVYLIEFLAGIICLCDKNERIDSELCALEVIANNCLMKSE